MNNIISKIDENSLAEEIGIEVGDKLLSINGSKVNDLIDFRYLMAEENVILEIEKKDGELWDIEVEKDYDEPLGVDFENPIMDRAKSCQNKCIFCFIDQLPKGMRESLYFKDDDSRLSFLQGNFITLTNMKDEDIDRIIKYRISPINVSVHTTNPELRRLMTNNRFAGNIFERLKKLSEANLTINCQIVLIPDINDGLELERTLNDLYSLYPSIRNVAIVPIGITKFREGLFNLRTFTKEESNATIELVEKYQKKFFEEIGDSFARLSDEFYVVAGRNFPSDEVYGDYDQLEDGVGMITYYRNIIDETLPNLNSKGVGSFTIPTGVSAYNEIKNCGEKVKKHNPNININVIEVKNKFFGETITVAGLLTGRDIINALKDCENLGEYIILSSNMLRKGYELGGNGEKIFLDDITVEDMEKEMNRKVIIVDYTGDDFIEKLNDHLREE